MSYAAPSYLLDQALCFRDAGAAFVPPKPWAQGEDPKRVTQAYLLPAPAQAFLQRFTAETGGSSSGTDSAS